MLQKSKWLSGSRITINQVLIAVMLPSLAFSNSGVKSKPVTGKSIGVSLKSTQAITVKGKVTDEKGDGLPGVSVIEKGTSNGVITDINGNFSINVADENSVLAFSFVGFEKREISITGRTSLTVELKEDSKLLNEVVVIGYGTQKRSDLTGSIASVNMKDVKSLPVSDAGQALQGRAAGVQVISSGAPGSNVTIRVRGVGTINDSDPLIVIDGVPSNVPLNTISTDDISTMDILKDASASAIYGARGANGVILITTKKGVAGKGKLDFKAMTGVRSATNTVEMLNASQFAALHNEMMAANGQTLNPAYADPNSFTTSTDWLNELLKTTPTNSFSLAYSGGGDKSTYYVSGTLLDEAGIAINNKYKRFAIQVNTDSKVFDWLRFSNNLTLSHDRKSSGSINIRNAMSALPVQPVYNADGTWSGPEGQSSWYGDVRNPIGEATINDNKTLGYNVLGNLSGEVTLIPQLKFKSTFGLQASFWDSRGWSPKYDWKPISQPFSTLNSSFNKNLTYLWDNTLTYDSFFNDVHHLTLLAGTSAQDNRFDYVSASKANFISDGAQQLNNGTMLPTASGNASDWALFSLLARANYAYKDKYLVTATVRRDASSRFGSSHRWGTFPSASVKWRISNESFFNKNNFIQDLAFRAGYGVTGNQSIGNYAYASILSTNQYVFNGTIVNSVVPLVLPNGNVHWEEVAQSNIALDAVLINGRMNVTAEAYIKNTNDMLVPMAVPALTGYSDQIVPSINAGKVSNKGIELSISSQNVKSNSFEWNTNFNVSYNQNKVVSLNGDVPIYGGSLASQNTNIQKNGYPVNSFYGVIATGIFQTQEEVDNYAKQQQGSDTYNSTAPGDLKFLDINNDGQINDADRTFIGDPNPRFTFALNNSVNWKNLDFSVFLQGVEGNSILNGNRIYQEGMAVAQNQTTAVLNRWTGPNTSNEVPRAVFNDPNKNTRPSTRFIEDGSYLRLKNVTLGYTLPKSLIKHAKMNTARLYVSGQNLLTFTKYTGFDPEVSSNGIDMSLYPITRIVSAGINIGF